MTTITLSEAQTHLAQWAREVAELGEPVIITQAGHPPSVLLALDDYEGLMETLEVLADEDLRAAIQEGLADVRAGRTVEHEEFFGLFPC